MIDASQCVIGVDGGGTKTVAWLAPLDSNDSARVLGRGAAGPGNARSAGFDVAQANIDAAIDRAFADAGLPRETVAAACLGLAGVGRPADRDRMRAWAVERRIGEAVSVTTDADPILSAVSDANWGVALIAGTGSFAWGRNRADQSARCGGWGYLLGDEGSGYAIALAGLHAAARSFDGRGPESSLVLHLQRYLDLPTPQDLVERIYRPDITRERIASLAAVVFEAAETDEIAKGIVDSAAHDLAELVTVVARRLDFAAGEYPLALAGSVIVNQPGLRQTMLTELDYNGVRPGTVELVADPVRGAVVMARVLKRA